MNTITINNHDTKTVETYQVASDAYTRELSYIMALEYQAYPDFDTFNDPVDMEFYDMYYTRYNVRCDLDNEGYFDLWSEAWD